MRKFMLASIALLMMCQPKETENNANIMESTIKEYYG
jgi:hypothetical protein